MKVSVTDTERRHPEQGHPPGWTYSRRWVTSAHHIICHILGTRICIVLMTLHRKDDECHGSVVRNRVTHFCPGGRSTWSLRGEVP